MDDEKKDSTDHKKKEELDKMMQMYLDNMGQCMVKRYNFCTFIITMVLSGLAIFLFLTCKLCLGVETLICLVLSFWEPRYSIPLWLGIVLLVVAGWSFHIGGLRVTYESFFT
jgi:hypothetical protein